MSRILREKIEACIQACTQHIENSRRHVGDDVGWHQHLGTHKIGIVATAMVLLYYKRLELECPEKAECIEFISRKVNADGGWPYISNTHGQSNVESTCWALLALYSYAPDESQNLITDGVNWLLSKYVYLGYSDNGWSFADESSPRIYITSFVLRVLQKLGKSADQRFESAKKWIIDSQNDDGGWGELPDKGSSLFFTCYVINTLIDCNIDKNDSIIQTAKSWLDQRISDLPITDPSMLCYLEFIEYGTGSNRTRIPFFHYVAPHILETYSALERKAPQAFKVLKATLDNCRGGKIEHPMLENSKIVPVWSLYDTVVGLEEWKISGWEWDKIYQFAILFRETKGFGKYNPIGYIATVKQWILNGILLVAVIMPLLHYYENIINWMNISSGEWWGQLLISFSASCLYGFMVCLFRWLNKKIGII